MRENATQAAPPTGANEITRPGDIGRPTTCPPWCVVDHRLDDLAAGFHHDGQPETVVPGYRLDVDEPDDLNVLLTQYVPAGSGEPWAVQVELQDRHRAVAVLTPLEALDLASALMRAAAAAITA